MVKGLRLPILIFFAAFLFLAGAIYVRFIQDDGDTPTDEVNVVASTATPTLTPTDAPTATPAPTVVPPPPAAQIAPPVAGQLTEGLVGTIGKLNPLYATYNPVDNDITSLIFEGLTTINQYGEVVPDLAERWGVSPDGTDYVFALRRDVLWQDGVPFTSADVKYTIDVMRSADFQGDKGLTRFWRTVEMTVVDDYTLRFRLVQPLASFPEYLRVGILPVHVLAGYPVANLDRHPFNLHPIGTGMYQLDALLSDGGRIAGVRLRVAPTYRQRFPDQSFPIDTLIFRTFDTPEEALAAYLRGDVNSVAHLPPSYMNQLYTLPNMAIYSTAYSAVGFIIYNWEREEVGYLAEQRGRLALAQGLDRQAVVAQAMSPLAVVADSPLIPGMWAYVGGFRYPTYDPNAARAIVDSLNYDYTPSEEATTDEDAEETPSAETTDGTPAPEGTPEGVEETPTDEAEIRQMRKNFTILVVNKPELDALAQGVAAQWSAIGFSVTVEAVDEATFRQRLDDGDFDTAIVEYSFAPYADPDSYTFWHVGQYEEGLNYGGMRDMRLSEVLEKARRETVGINRSNFYRQFQQIFAERVPALPLYYPVFVYVMDERLEGVQLGFISTPSDRFRTITDWTWQLAE